MIGEPLLVRIGSATWSHRTPSTGSGVSSREMQTRMGRSGAMSFRLCQEAILSTNGARKPSPGVWAPGWFSEPLRNPCRLLRQDLDRLRDAKHGDHEQDDGDFHGVLRLSS